MERNYRSESLPSFEGNELCIEPEYCINLRGRSEICQKCVDACPSDALTLNIDEISLDSDLCQNCGACVSFCPTATLKLTGFSPDRFVETASSTESVHVHCRESRDGGGGVVIPCFLTLNSALVAAAFGRGVSNWSFHGLDECEKCSRGDAREHCLDITEQLSNWFGEKSPDINQSPITKDEGERLAEHQTRVSRRGFLKLAGAQGFEQVSNWVFPVEPEQDLLNELPFFQHQGLPQKPQPGLALLAGVADTLPWQPDAHLPWYRHEFSEDCSVCLSCGERCPTGALISVEEKGVAALGYQQDLCSDCGLCEKICPTSAIRVGGHPSIKQLTANRQAVVRRQQNQCTNCGHPFIAATGESLCQTCAKEQALDEDWMSILGE